MMGKLFYSVGEFAKLTGLSPSTIRTFCDRGIVTCYRPSGQKRLIPAEALEELKSNRYATKKLPKEKIMHHKGSELRVTPIYKRA